MLVSDQFDIARDESDDWFDAILDADTELFVDPFLVFKETAPHWIEAHRTIVGHFDRCFRLIAEGNRNPQSTSYRKAVDLLRFAEPKECCLGYTARGTAGAGSGAGHAKLIAEAMCEAITRGLTHLQHFEELGILNEGFGPDRISDIACNILKPRLIAYTQAVAARRAIPLEYHDIYPTGFDDTRVRWVGGCEPLPTNPYTGGPLLLVPERFLRRLPVLNATDWWRDFEAEKLREDVNYDVMRNVNKAAIVAIARSNPEHVRRWIADKGGHSATSYDVAKDPSGVYRWDPDASRFAKAHPIILPAPQTPEDFFKVIELVIEQFRLFVEDEGGWELLWKDGTSEKNERAVQLLFRGIAKHYCHANGVVLDREVNLGCGPVDFKFSNGYSRRALLEVKKLHNTKFWSGVRSQLPAYLKSDECKDGWFLVVQYKDDKASAKKLDVLPTHIADAGRARNMKPRYAVVDAQPKASASML